MELFKNILISLSIVGLFFLTGLYVLGVTAPLIEAGREEVLVDGQWVEYRSYTTEEYPGEVAVASGEAYVSSSTISGEAHSSWFYKGSAPAELFSEENQLLWQGDAYTEESDVYDRVVPFFVDLNISDYSGYATLIMYNGTEDEAEYKKHSYSTTILIEN